MHFHLYIIGDILQGKTVLSLFSKAVVCNADVQCWIEKVKQHVQFKDSLQVEKNIVKVKPVHLQPDRGFIKTNDFFLFLTLTSAVYHTYYSQLSLVRTHSFFRNLSVI